LDLEIFHSIWPLTLEVQREHPLFFIEAQSKWHSE